ncbi:MAG TPA: PQQ-binding-like beta-propeller repeat protein, partial [Burkholderiaceae bacterium]|nr:PQQ-binding-like beta-propeller repeat protein [Burkholderiaceae bacterium]
MAALRESRRRLLLSLPLAALSNAASAAPAWSIAAAGRAGVGFQPRFAGASLWTASADGTVIRVDPRDGSTVWRRDVGTRLSAGVGSDGTRAVVAGRDGSVLLLDADGRTRWTVPLGAEVITPPAIAQDVVVVRTGDNRLIALDADDGRRLWTFQ